MSSAFSKNRLEALSDGLFAVAMTVLVLDIKVPTGVAPGGLAAALAHQGTAWISFAITFMLAAVFWVQQHRVLHALAAASGVTIALTMVMLAFVSLLPFSTSLWGHYLRDPFATTVYFANQFVIAFILVVQMEIARARGEFMDGVDLGRLRFRVWLMCLLLACQGASAYFVRAEHLAFPVAIFLIAARIGRKVYVARAANSRPASVS